MRQFIYLFWWIISVNVVFFVVFFANGSDYGSHYLQVAKNNPVNLSTFKNPVKNQANKNQVKEKALPVSVSSSVSSSRKIQLGKALVSRQKLSKEVSVILQDPLMQKKWSLKKIQSKDAWSKFSQGSSNIVVAVIDTGIDVQHEDLRNNIWHNPKEIPNNNKDDDGNGYIDDIYGWNFVKNNNKVYDNHGHGTHIAGIIGAEGGNGIGVSGVAPKVSLMALKYYDPTDDGSNNLANTVRAINYAVKNGAHIINYSGGGLEGNEKEKQAIQRACEKGILFVAAAGNEKSNADKTGYFPAGYPLDCILSVTATNVGDRVLSSSNWGEKSVHTAAPGDNILSTLPANKYGMMTGTSQATAVASGSAVLVMGYYKVHSAHFVISQLKMTGDIKKSLNKKTTQRRRLNIYRALAMRNMSVNFMDQLIDAQGQKFFSSDQPEVNDVSAEDEDINIVHRVLLKVDSDHSKSKKHSRRNGRHPSSETSSKRERFSVPLLKRWFWKPRSH